MNNPPPQDMHVLVVLDHPRRDSFCAAVADRFILGAQAAGHTTELADLHSENFNPLWTAEDDRAVGPEYLPSDILREQKRIAGADAICLVFPLFWWGMPSMMKGWIDRVWSWGWAYDRLDDPNASLQRPRSGLLLVPAGAKSDEMEQKGYRRALETSWMEGTFGYFGFSPRRLEILNGSTGSKPRRLALLQRAYDLGEALPKPSTNGN